MSAIGQRGNHLDARVERERSRAKAAADHSRPEARGVAGPAMAARSSEARGGPPWRATELQEARHGGNFPATAEQLVPHRRRLVPRRSRARRHGGHHHAGHGTTTALVDQRHLTAVAAALVDQHRLTAAAGEGSARRERERERGRSGEGESMGIGEGGEGENEKGGRGE